MRSLSAVGWLLLLIYLYYYHLEIIIVLGKSCGAPPPNQMATPSMTIGYFGDNVTYTCDHTHLQIGGGTGRHRCAENGTWEADDVDPPPLCLGL